MTERDEIGGFWSYCRATVWQPWWALVTEGFVFVFLAWLTWIRDNLTADETQKRYATLRFIPKWRWQTWLVLFLVFLIFYSLSNSYSLWKRERNETKRLRGETHGPELVIVYGDHENVHKADGVASFANPLTIRNLSKDRNAYNIEVKDLVTPSGSATFIPKVVSCIPADGRSHVSPRVRDADLPPEN